MLNNWMIVYFLNKNRNPVKEFIVSLSFKQRAKIFRIFNLIEEYGINSISPHVRRLLGTPFWEIRILGKDNLRIIYLIPQRLSVLVLHGFIKKTQRTDQREINIALNRYKVWRVQNRLDR